jgi:nucleoside-diphosphate-sugar epimerase
MIKEKNLVLGITGSIGRATAKALSEKGEKVIGFARNLNKANKYLKELENVELFLGDASNLIDIEKASEDCKNIFYCVHIPYPRWEAEARELLSVSIEAAVKTGAQLIFPGNVYVYGKPVYNPVDEKHPWNAHTKKGKIRIDMENMLKGAKEKKGLKYLVVRMPDFYGPFVINEFYEKIFFNALGGKTIQWFGNLDIPTEFIFIEDAGNAMAAAALSGKSGGEEYNVPGHSVTTAKKFLEEIALQAGKNSKIKALNSVFVVRLGGLFNPLAREFAEMMYLKQVELILNGKKFLDTFGSIPSTPYEEGIAKTLEWAGGYLKLAVGKMQ